MILSSKTFDFLYYSGLSHHSLLDFFSNVKPHGRCCHFKVIWDFRSQVCRLHVLVLKLSIFYKLNSQQMISRLNSGMILKTLGPLTVSFSQVDLFYLCIAYLPNSFLSVYCMCCHVWVPLCLHVIKVVLTLPLGASRALWAAPAAAGVTEAETSQGWGVRGLWKFLGFSENCSATPGSLLVHSWVPLVKGWGLGEWGTAEQRSHAWTVKLALLLPAHTFYCLQYLFSFVYELIGFGYFLHTCHWWR